MLTAQCLLSRQSVLSDTDGMPQAINLNTCIIFLTLASTSF